MNLASPQKIDLQDSLSSSMMLETCAMSEQSPIISSQDEEAGHLIKEIHILGHIGPIGYLMLVTLLTGVCLIPFIIAGMLIGFMIWG